MRTDTGLVAAWQRRWRRRIAVALMVSAGPNTALACIGDCKGAGRVDIADLIVGVDIALGFAPVTDCEAFANPARIVNIAQLVAGVNNALNGCADHRFVDNGDGTILDKQTGLMWEKKVGIGGGVDAGNPHAADDVYFWNGECELDGNLCQPNQAAAAACRQGTQGDQSACATCGPSDLSLDNSCRLDPNGEITTIWDWLTQLNAANFAGYTDWRVPTVGELESILDYSNDHPATDSAFNGTDCGATCTDVTSAACSCTQYQDYCDSQGPYWSGTTNVAEPDRGAWIVSFGQGAASNLSHVFCPDQYVRAVRGGVPAPVPRFLDNGNGTVTDKKTGLIWEKKASFGAGTDPGDLHGADNRYGWAGKCKMATDTFCQPSAAAAAACAHGTQGNQIGCATCQAAQGACNVDPNGDGSLTTIWDWLTQLNAANFAGQVDWRIPTEGELESIVDYGTDDPALNSALGDPPCNLFPRGTSPFCQGDWSASMFWDPGDVGAWALGFDEGEVTAFDLCDGSNVRAVRGGP